MDKQYRWYVIRSHSEPIRVEYYGDFECDGEDYCVIKNNKTVLVASKDEIFESIDKAKHKVSDNFASDSIKLLKHRIQHFSEQSSFESDKKAWNLLYNYLFQSPNFENYMHSVYYDSLNDEPTYQENLRYKLLKH